MLNRVIAAAAFAVLASTAYAGDTNTSNTTTGATINQQSVQNLPQEISSKLKQDGYTDVKVVPGSFLVSAKDKRGDPVTMVIGPHSMLVMTEANSDANQDGNTGSINPNQSKK